MTRVVSALHDVKTRCDAPEWEGLVALAVAHPIAELIGQSPLGARPRDPSRRNAPDPIAIDLLRGATRPRSVTAIGRAVFDFELRLPTLASVAGRTRFLRAELESRAAFPDQRVLALCVGHCAEWDLRLLARYPRNARLVVANEDARSLAAVLRRVPDRRVETARLSRRPTLTFPSRRIETFEFIYGSLLIDDLTDEEARRLLRDLFALLAPGGTMLVPALTPGREDEGYVDAFLGWRLAGHEKGALLGLLANDPSLHRSHVHHEKNTGLYLFSKRA